MENKTNTDANVFVSSEIDFKELLEVIWQSKWKVIAFTFGICLLTVIYSINLPNIYQSKAILSPVGEQNNISQMVRNYGGLASLAGIDLSSQSNGGNLTKAKEKLNSLSFFSENILPNIFLPNLMAIDSWNSKSNTIFYDKNIYDFASKQWVRNYNFPRTQIPSAQESYEVFKNIMQVSEDPLTGFVTITIEHQSPFIAQSWAKLIVQEINYFFRAKDKLEAQVAMDFLNKQLALTQFVEVKQAIAQILQQKTQQLTLVEASEFYVFDYIDPPEVMELKSRPNRALICILGAFLGGFIIVSFVLLKFLTEKYFLNNKFKPLLKED